MWILISTMVFVNLVFYSTSKKYAKYNEGMLFLVTIPEYALDSIDVIKLNDSYKKQLKLILLLSLTTCVLFVILTSYLSKLFFTFAFILVLFLNIIIFQMSFKKTREKLLSIKKQNNWLVLSDNGYKVDLNLSTFMEKRTFKLKRYIIVIFIDLLAIFYMLKYQADLIMYPYMFIQIIVLIGGLLFIKKLSNQTFCKDSEANITINILRKNTFYDSFFFLILCDTLFNLVIQLYLLEKLTFTYIFITILLTLISIIFTILKVNEYHNKKTEILAHYKETTYIISNDACWKIGIFGPCYHNPYDPRTLISMPGGTQLAFNTAKKGYRYFIVGIISFILIIIIWLFGYPYYLDMTNNLVDLSLQENKVIITSPFYYHDINIDNINKVELTDNLGKGHRTNGTDTGIYAKGNYTFDKYGKCKVYLASLHEYYIVIHTNDTTTYIINDDRIDDTKLFYQKLLKEVNHDH